MACRKLRRILSARHIRFAVIATTVLLIILFAYYWVRSSTSTRYLKLQRQITNKPYKLIRVTNIPLKHVPLNEIYDYTSEDDRSIDFDDRRQKFMVDTPGCQIPIAMVRYATILPKNDVLCGRRAVFLSKQDDQSVRVRIKSRVMKLYLKTSKFYCCHRFIKRSSTKGREHLDVEYTNCKEIQDGETIELVTDFVNVKCFEFDKQNRTAVIYSDVYAFAKRIDAARDVRNTRDKTKYNVLMLGMDSMSLSRFAQTMPRTIGFFQDNFWLGFRGYHKVEESNFPNFMVAFTGKNYSTISKLCSKKMDKCNKLLIWSKFKESGYVTAYGEDYLHLPDTFKKPFAFHRPPTDHYLRTFFLHGETIHYKRNYSIVCNEKAPSGQHLLDFAVDFATTYRRSSFFGVFRMNSYSHDPLQHPQYADKMFENFFNQLSYTGVLENTFVIFFSDHGPRFGKYRLHGESYYEDRMPALFMWVPSRFKGQQSLLYRSSVANEFKLLTPYDLYNTLVAIHGISHSFNYTGDFSEGCPKCRSIFNVVSLNRTCDDVGIHMKWCSCHRLYPLEVHDSEGIKSVLHAVKEIKIMVQNFRTKPCWSCQNVNLQKILRIHFYYSHFTLYYVTAFSLTPGNITVEATVSRKDTTMEMVGTVSVIESHKSAANCTINVTDRTFCTCRKKAECT
ncbi:uncharacterized protein LOC114364349 [Ostrinia furnacalis]|uniref:uncharacterized protein LOC114364349 n=1 Tax=Ostrinia furnacalis TaxID=93504 RepID=UPI00103B0B7B|nr:uncharacterized protein LOC114364349 [Ostrinia furnacalis]